MDISAKKIKIEGKFNTIEPLKSLVREHHVEAGEING